MKSISSELSDHLQEEVTTLCTCWRLVRQDGTEFFFTDHDVDLVVGDNTYVSAYGYDRTAIANDSSLAVDNLDIVGIFNSEQITEEELRAGLFDYATIYVFLVNWADLTQGVLKLRKGYIGEVSLTQTGMFKAELRGLTQLLSQSIGECYSNMCRADLGDERCGFMLEATNQWAAETEFESGDYIYTTNDYVPEFTDLVNPGAEEGDLTGWTTGSGNPRVISSWSGLAPFLGDYFFAGFTQSGSIYQDVALPAGSSSSSSTSSTTSHSTSSTTTAAPDLTVAVCGAFFAQPTNTLGDTFKLTMYALDSGLSVLDSATTGDLTAEAEDTWERHELTLELPEDTAYVRVEFSYTKGSGAWALAAMDAAYLFVGASEIEDKGAYMFECTTAGATGVAEPTWPTTPGDTVTDGTVVWTCRNQITDFGMVSYPLTRKSFLCSSLNGNDDYYNGGLLTWLTGNNAGRSVEVKDYYGDSGLITLHLPLPYEPESGDILKVFPGCDKKLYTCRDTFDNVLNFRGEPFIPGTDEYLSYPDAK